MLSGVVGDAVMKKNRWIGEQAVFLVVLLSCGD